MGMKKFMKWTVGLAVAALLVSASRASIVIYQDTFNRTDAALNGDQLGVASGFTGTGGYGGSETATWWAGPSFTTDGTVAHSGGSGKAYLPFTPQAGLVYTLSVGMQNVSSGNWVAIGFGTVNFGNTPDTLSFHDGGTNPAPWELLWYGNNGSTWWEGPGTTGSTGFSYANGGGGSGWNQLQIVLDTQTDVNNWTATLFVNGNQCPTTYTYSAASWAPNAIGWGAQSTAGVDMANADTFSLTVIPEPATFGMLGAAAVAMLLRRRVRR
jgi:hypothetical protein